MADDGPQPLLNTNALSLAALQSLVAERGRVIQPFRLEGIVCAVARERKLVALQDDSATVLLELPFVDPTLREGNRLAVDANHCAVTRGRFALQLGTAPVVELDGRHPPHTKSGSVFLESGMQPLQVEWFNGVSSGSLRLEYEGPGVPRQDIPAAVLWRRSVAATREAAFQPGLDFAAYTGNGWPALPDFRTLEPEVKGVAENFDVSRRTRDEEAGMVFTGFLQIATAGIYTFHDTSDDGSRLYIGNPAATCASSILEHEPVAPRTHSLAQALVERKPQQWVALEGRVAFVHQSAGRLELELADGGDPVPVTVIDARPLLNTPLLHQRVRMTGVCQVTRDPDQERTARVIVAGAEQVEILGPPRALNPEDVLATAEQIRGLQPHEARKPFRARLRGVVTMTTPGSLVLQDPTGGVFIHHAAGEWVDQPRAGEVWEIEGLTDPGDFSPVVRAERAVCLGSAPLPEPIRPTWEQLLNGSLDAEQVEIQGVVTALTAREIYLLTRDGKVRVNTHEYYPLPQLPADGRNLVGSVVRLRGVFTANWDLGTGRVKAGEFFIGNAMLGVDEPAPRDPFSATTKRATDLLLFTSHASALKRIKVAGQILYAGPREYFLLDGTNGLRFLTKEALPLRAGDLVEAVGFPRLGGPSPVLVEALARKTGNAPLPEPNSVSVEELFDRGRDSTLVRIEALLLSGTVRKEERVLELQAGPHHFLARVRPDTGAGTTLRRGSRLQLTGVYASAREDRAGNSLDAFELLLDRAADIVVLQRGPWWTVRHTIAVISIMSGGLFLTLVWVRVLRRTVAQRTAQLKLEIEQRQLVEQRRIMELERTRVAQDLHDELGAGLTEVGILGSLAKNPAIAPEKKEGYLDQLMELSRSLVTGLDEIVWAVNPRYDSVADLAGYYSLFAQRFLNLAGITCRLQVAEAIPEHPLDSRLRHGIFLAFKEALNNVVRHSGATEVQLAIGVDGGGLNIRVADNGRGFESGDGAPGMDGMTGMNQRMQKLGGVCRIHGRPGHGTTVELSLPLGRNNS